VKTKGWAVVVLGAACIVAGILAKRVFDYREYLMLFHIAGGILLVAGAMMILSGRKQP
jgi:membrane-bound ClpP family serine protease